VYAAGIIDVWTREVVGYAVALQITNRLASIALHSAVRAHRPAPGCIHHSTCGTQYSMRGYRRLLREYGLTASVGELSAATSLPGGGGVGLFASRQVIELPAYEDWEDVLPRAKEFIRTVYSSEWLDLILNDCVKASTPKAPAL
jgi:putative transposase